MNNSELPIDLNIATSSTSNAATTDTTIESWINNGNHSSYHVGTKNAMPYNELPIAVKVDVIKDYEKLNCSQRALAKKYKISRATVNQIIKQKQRYVSEFEKMRTMATHGSGGLKPNASCMQMKRVRKTNITTLNHIMEEFVEASRINKWDITGPKLKEKARQVARQLGLFDFKASNGWLDSFKKRCALEFNGKDSHRKKQCRNNNCLNSCTLLVTNNQLNNTAVNNNNNDLQIVNNNNVNQLNTGQHFITLDANNCQQIIEEALNAENQLSSNMVSSFSQSNGVSGLNSNSQHSQPQELLHVTANDNECGQQMAFSLNASQQRHNEQLHHQLQQQQQVLGANAYELPNTTTWVIDYDSIRGALSAASPSDATALSQGHSSSATSASPLSDANCSELFDISSQQLINGNDEDETVDLVEEIDMKHSINIVKNNSQQQQLNANSSDLVVRVSAPQSESDTDDEENTLKVPHISKVRDALDTLEQFALTRAPSLLPSVLAVRQDVGNFVIQRHQQLETRRHHQRAQ